MDTEKKKKNLTDAGARFMKGGDGKIAVNYNGQIVVSEDQVIVAAEVISEPNDREALISILEQTEANIREEIVEIVADAGYASYDNYEYLKERGKMGYIPDQYFEKKGCGEYEREENRYHSENFVYDKEKYKKRLHTVESPFGHIKHNLGYRSFLLRGLNKVGGEFTLMCIGYNLKKIQSFLTQSSEDKQKGILHGKLGISICDIPCISFLIRVLKRFIFDFLCLSASVA